MIPFWIRRQFVKLRNTIHLSRGDDETDIAGTLESVKKSIQIRGANIWILCCGSLLASIGLDTNSTVLILSAMLISPLMKPLLGIGIFYFTHDYDNLKQAMQKVSIAVVASILTSFLYFSVTPLGDMTPEISARVKPTLIDALIALVGGIAGIISITRKDQITIVPGVAVAITILPPLCVVGYGLSTWQWDIVFGAGYLFLINIIIICFVASYIVKWLKFPVLRQVSRKYRRKSLRVSIVGLIIALTPGYYWFTEMMTEKTHKNQIQAFIDAKIDPMTEVIDWRMTQTDSLRHAEIFTSGRLIAEDTLEILHHSFDSLGLKNTTLKILQPRVEEKLDRISHQIDSVKQRQSDPLIAEDKVMKEVEILFEEVENIHKLSVRNGIHIYGVKWKTPLLMLFRKQQQLDKIDRFMELQLDTTTHVVQLKS